MNTTPNWELKAMLPMNLRLASMSLAALAALSMAGSAKAADFVWSGPSGGDWFGPNWTVGGTPGQTAADEFTGSGIAKIIDYYSDANADTVFNGDDSFTVTGATIDNFATGTGTAYFHDNSVINITNSSVRLYADTFLPTKVLDSSVMTVVNSTVHWTRGANTGNAFVIGDSATMETTPSVTLTDSTMIVDQFRSSDSMALGGDFQMFAAGTYQMTDSSLTVSRIWQIDDASQATVNTSAGVSTVDVGFLRMFDTATLDVSNTTLTSGSDIDLRNSSSATITSSTTSADIFELRNSAQVTLDGGSLDVTGGGGVAWELYNSSQMTITGGAQVSSPYLRIGSTNASVIFESGQITLQDGNVLRSDSGVGFSGTLNVTGGPGDVSITQQGVTSIGNNLAFKLFQGFASIDGDRINPSGDGIENFYGGFTGAEIDILNTWFAGDVVNGKYFQLTNANGDGTGDITLDVLQATVQPGDYNFDGAVDVADYTVWRDNLGELAGTLGAADTTGLDIGLAQYDLWRRNFGRSIPAPALTAGAAPEPTALALVAIGGMALAGSRRGGRNPLG